MSSTRRHEEIQEILPAAALGTLEAADLDPVRNRAVRARLVARARMDQPGRAGAPDYARLPSTSQRALATVYRWSGWMVAAGLAGVLLVHHSIHRPLDYGWLAAGVLVVVILGLGVYTRVQRSRVAALEARLADLGAKGPGT